MAFDVGAGLSLMGQSLAQTAQVGLVDSMRADLENQKLQLANQLAMQRQGQQQQFETEQQGRQFAQQSQENQLNRQSEEKRTGMSTSAMLGAAQIGAASRENIAAMQAKTALEVERVKSETALQGYKMMYQRGVDVAQINSAIRNTSMLSDDALNTAASYFNAKGELPQMGFSSRADRAAIINKAAELRKQNGVSDEQWATQKGTAEAAKPALAALTRQANLAASFEKTARDNGQVLQEALADPKALGPTGLPIFDTLVQSVKRWGAGEPAVGALDQALDTYLTETAKILSGATGAAGVPVDFKKQMMEKLSRADNIQTFQAVMRVLDSDRLNRIKDYQSQITELTKAGATGRGTPLQSQEAGPAHTPLNPTALPPIPRNQNGAPDLGSMNPGQGYYVPPGSMAPPGVYHLDPLTGRVMQGPPVQEQP